MNHKKKNTSFTLIELLVVIVIIGVLAGVIMVTTSSSVSNANLARAKAFSSNVQNSMLLNLVSEWTFDEGTTTSGDAEVSDVKDSWGVSDGTVVGHAPSILTGNNCVYGKCLSFDGSTEYIDCGMDNSLIKSSHERTFSSWIYVTGNQYVFRAIISSTNTSWVHFQLIDTDNLQIYFYGPAKSATSTTLFNSSNYNKWFHAVGLWDGTHAKLYINGVLEGTSSLGSGDSVASTSNVHIGNGYSNGRFFKGSIDDVRVYDTALSSSQIKQNYVVGLNSLLANGNISKEEYDNRISELASN